MGDSIRRYGRAAVPAAVMALVLLAGCGGPRPGDPDYLYSRQYYKDRQDRLLNAVVDSRRTDLHRLQAIRNEQRRQAVEDYRTWQAIRERQARYRPPGQDPAEIAAAIAVIRQAQAERARLRAEKRAAEQARWQQFEQYRQQRLR